MKNNKVENGEVIEKFREKFHPDVKVMPGAPLDEYEQWLLNTLTEFERETKERIKLCAKEQSCSMCMESLSQLEKEKHT